MDEIKQRLHDTSEQCYKSYEAWHGNEKDSTARENLIESIHELRKVASRLEIQLAVSESRQSAQKKLPIPGHRDSTRRNNDDDRGNKGKRDGGVKKSPMKRQKPPAKKEASS